MVRRAVYPGTFDPITNGHMDIVNRGLTVFDEVIVAIADNQDKGPLFDLNERVNMAKAIFADNQKVRVEGFDTLLVDFVKQSSSQVIIRGLRAVSDFEFEFQLASMNKQLARSIETMFLVPSEQYSFLSSSLVKEVARLGGDVSSFVPSLVQEALHAQYRG